MLAWHGEEWLTSHQAQYWRTNPWCPLKWRKTCLDIMEEKNQSLQESNPSHLSHKSLTMQDELPHLLLWPHNICIWLTQMHLNSYLSFICKWCNFVINQTPPHFYYSNFLFHLKYIKLFFHLYSITIPTCSVTVSVPGPR